MYTHARPARLVQMDISLSGTWMEWQWLQIPNRLAKLYNTTFPIQQVSRDYTGFKNDKKPAVVLSVRAEHSRKINNTLRLKRL